MTTTTTTTATTTTTTARPPLQHWKLLVTTIRIVCFQFPTLNAHNFYRYIRTNNDDDDTNNNDNENNNTTTNNPLVVGPEYDDEDEYFLYYMSFGRGFCSWWTLRTKYMNTIALFRLYLPIAITTMLLLMPVGYELSSSYQQYIDPFVAMIVLCYIISLSVAILIQGTAELYAHYFCIVPTSTTNDNNTSTNNMDDDDDDDTATTIIDEALNSNNRTTSSSSSNSSTNEESIGPSSNNADNNDAEVSSRTTTTATRAQPPNHPNQHQQERQLLAEFYRRCRYQQIVPGWWYDCMVTVVYEKSYLITGIFIITFVLSIPFMLVFEFVLFMVSINDNYSLWISIPIEIVTTIGLLYLCTIYLIIVIPCLLIECNPDTASSRNIESIIVNPIDNTTSDRTRSSSASRFSYWHIIYNPFWSMYRCSQLTKYYRWTLVVYCVLFLLLAAGLETLSNTIKERYLETPQDHDPYTNYQHDTESTITFILGIVLEYLPAILLLPLAAIVQTLVYIELRTIYDKGYYSYNTLQAELQQQNILVTGTTTPNATSTTNDLAAPLLFVPQSSFTVQQQQQQQHEQGNGSSSSCVFEVEYGL